MPTPSPNQPPDPHSPPSLSSSSCPDDLQSSSTRQSRRYPPPRNHDEGLNMQPNEQSYIAATSGHADALRSSVVDGAEPVAAERIILVDEPTSIEPSSRSTTMSPVPHSITTARTLPLPAPTANESTKATESDGGALSVSKTRVHSLSSRWRTAATETLRHSPSGPSIPNGPSPPAVARFDDGLPYLPMGPGYSSSRVIPITPSSFLRPGSKFHGTQQSERQVYDVQVEIKHVDMRESFLCGYLRIQGLTADHPTLTTYFEGEIIGDQYGFFTKHDDWGANTKVDLSHWSKFSAFRPYLKHARKGPINITDAGQRENIFMRWKEHFLVPDHRVRTISGASFEGFYYICFNQVKGEVSGIYFHSKSEKFQQLELKHVSDRGCFSAIEFR